MCLFRYLSDSRCFLHKLASYYLLLVPPLLLVHQFLNYNYYNLSLDLIHAPPPQCFHWQESLLHKMPFPSNQVIWCVISVAKLFLVKLIGLKIFNAGMPTVMVIVVKILGNAGLGIG